MTNFSNLNNSISYKFILFILSITIFYKAGSQSKIAVAKATTTQFYASIDSAIYYADNSSTIYVPGGNYAIGNLSISKAVKIIGAGYWPDSTLATGKTTFSGNINFLKGADSGLITGIEVKGRIQFGTNSTNGASNYGISRCSMYELWLGYTNGNDAPTNSRDFFISENNISGVIYGNYAKNVLFLKNLLGESVYYFNGNATFLNNLFLYEGNIYSGILLGGVSSCEFRNNVFLKTLNCTYCTFFSSSDYNVLNNNVFSASFTFPVGNNTGSNNIMGKTSTDIFVNYNADIFVADYRMKSAGPGKNAGSDGFDIGIYGTSVPWKEGGVPFNPHIQKRDIATETDGTGKLKVNIKVQAQKR